MLRKFWELATRSNLNDDDDDDDDDDIDEKAKSAKYSFVQGNK